MLKKLVKYGNSNALILDRAILELLNISEGAILKLHTDGKSLIITPQEPAKATDVFMMTGKEMLNHTIETTLKAQVESLAADPIKNQQLEQWKPGTENGAKLTQAFQVIMEKYRNNVDKLGTEAFLKDIDALAEKYHGDKSSPGFLKEFLALRVQHAPNLVNMDREMIEAKKALGMPDFL